jgi:hypothetical protein
MPAARSLGRRAEPYYVSRIVEVPEPNFSEAQLQNAINTAYARAAFEHHGHWIMARVPTLLAEFDLGWDSAFYFPWLPYAPSVQNKGCNFFVQYKLSNTLLTSSAKEWDDWKRSYLRFRIPHVRQDSTTKKIVDDYHQWDRLKDLANRGYPVFYATNWTIEEADLDSAFRDGTLLDRVPSLDVRGVRSRHKHVTFTENSAGFRLHSAPERVPKTSLSEALVALGDEEMVSVGQATQSIIGSAREMWASSNRRFSEDLENVDSPQIDQLFPQPFRPWVKRARLSGLLRRHFAIELLWRPESYDPQDRTT